MKTFLKVFLIALILCQIRGLDTGMVLVKKLAGNSAGGVFSIGALTTTKTLVVKNILPTQYVNVYIMTKIRVLRSRNLDPLASETFSVGPSTDILYLYINGFIPQFSVNVTLDGVLISSIDPYAWGIYNPRLKEIALHKYVEIKNDCIIQADNAYFTVPYTTTTNAWLSFYNFTVAKAITKGVYLI